MYRDDPCICIPILSNFNSHSSEVSLVGLYLKFEDGTNEYINVKHPDKKKSNVDLTSFTLHSKSLVLNKKAMMYLGFDFGIDLNTYLSYYIDDYIDIKDFYPKIMEGMTNSMWKSPNLNCIIPLSKLIEFADGVATFTQKYFKPNLMSDKCVNYCNDFVDVFFNIEKNDILIGETPKKQDYWWYTATSRPSNSWDGFNFAAMNKTDGTRELVHSKFEDGKLLQFDYDAFHIKLLAKILDYKFDYHPYSQLKDELHLDIEYDVMKTRVFQNIYGGISDEFIHHEFFMRIQAMIDELYSMYQTDKSVSSWFYGKKFRDISKATPNKVFNYILQSLETEYNVMKIKSFKHLLDGKKSTFSMYMYDAFIFDIHPDEMYLVEVLKSAFQTDNMTVKTSIGKSFGDMTLI